MVRAFLIGALFASNAYATSFYNISCETPDKIPAKAFQAKLTLKAETWPFDEKNPADGLVRLEDITFSAAVLDENKAAEVGRAKQIDGEKNPRARKYKDFYQISMDKLVDVKDFSRYTPIDQCTFTVMLPTDMWKKTKFEAPVVTHCDQNGGTQAMQCELTFKKRN